MFVAFYRWQVRDGAEDRFRAAWIRVTQANYRKYGSLGSRLHRDQDGHWVAYAQWPSEAAWEKAWKSGVLADPEASAEMRECVLAASQEEQFHPSFRLDVVEDMLEEHPASQR